MKFIDVAPEWIRFRLFVIFVTFVVNTEALIHRHG